MATEYPATPRLDDVDEDDDVGLIRDSLDEHGSDDVDDVLPPPLRRGNGSVLVEEVGKELSDPSGAENGSSTSSDHGFIPQRVNYRPPVGQRGDVIEVRMSPANCRFMSQ